MTPHCSENGFGDYEEVWDRESIAPAAASYKGIGRNEKSAADSRLPGSGNACKPFTSARTLRVRSIVGLQKIYQILGAPIQSLQNDILRTCTDHSDLCRQS